MGPTAQIRKQAAAHQARRDRAARPFADDVAQTDVPRRVGVAASAVCHSHRNRKRKGAEGLRGKGR